MTGSRASASTEAAAAGAGERVLIVGVNWIGDTLMSMPAVQAFRRRRPFEAPPY